MEKRGEEDEYCSRVIHEQIKTMGNFYANVSLRTVNQAALINALIELKRTAFVSAERGGWIVAYDKQLELAEPEEAETLTATLSGKLSSVAVAASVYDDDVFWFCICDKGNHIDRYNSRPDYFEGTSSIPAGGNVRRIAEALPLHDAEQLVNTILHERHYVVETARHADLATALDLPEFSVGFGYKYLQRGELPVSLQGNDLISVVPAGQ
jgi:hypothetical protein